ncbi:MAG: hypothetical protein GY870_02160 [archaeon]|nr:hypothetical protein [archaeon]
MQFYSDYSKYNSGDNPEIGLYKLDDEGNFLNSAQLLYFSDFLGKSVIFTGESGVGKTGITAEYIKFLIQEQPKNKQNEIQYYILDMAPKRFSVNENYFGGKLTDFIPDLDSKEKINYIDCENIIPPRNTGHSAEEVLDFCEKNFQNINPKLESVINHIAEISPKNIKNSHLFHYFFIVNDISLYLHKGSTKFIDRLLKIQKKANNLTIFLNAYEGKGLIDDHDSNISAKEENLVSALKQKADFSIQLINR